MTINLGGGTVITVREDYQNYAAWCRSMGIRPADEKHWEKTVAAISPNQVIAMTTPRRYGL